MSIWHLYIVGRTCLVACRRLDTGELESPVTMRFYENQMSTSLIIRWWCLNRDRTERFTLCYLHSWCRTGSSPVSFKTSSLFAYDWHNFLKCLVGTRVPWSRLGLIQSIEKRPYPLVGGSWPGGASYSQGLDPVRRGNACGGTTQGLGGG